LIWKPHKSIEETNNYLRTCVKNWQNESEFTWTLKFSKNGAAVGMVAMRVRGIKADLGYCIAKKYWNQGFVTEAVSCLVSWALDQQGIHRVWAVCDVENKASARVLKKVGMQMEGILHKWIIHPNISDIPRNCYCYAITKTNIGQR
jgi:RimJ/RimL family protein N-acetyltransferase